jgi:hypothetical protein
MFHFPWFAPSALFIQTEVTRLSPRWVSPFGHLRLNVRLATPRSFSQPPTSFFASWHLGIHRTPLVAYLPSSLACPPPGGDSRLETKVQAPALRHGPGRMLSLESPLKHGESNFSQQKLNSTLRMHLSKNSSNPLAGIPVELIGIEPTTSSLQSWRSPS